MFINSEPPQFRKARELAISIENYEAIFLSHTSYVDTTKLQTNIPQNLIQAALDDPARKHGFISPTIKQRIIDAVQRHDVLESEYKQKVIID